MKTKVEVTPETTRQIAVRRATGSSLRDLEKEFGLSLFVLGKVLKSDMARSIIKGVIDDAVAGAVVEARSKLAKLTELSMSALEHHLKEKSLEAVKIHLKGLGMETIEKSDNKQAQTFTVIMPGAKAPIDVTNDTDVQEG